MDMKKRFYTIAVALLGFMSAFAQMPYQKGDEDGKNFFNHLDVSILAGSTGVGFDLAAPIGDMVQVRAGYSYVPRFEKTMNFDVYVGDDTDPAAQNSKFEKLSSTLKGLTGFDVDRSIDMVGRPTMNHFKLMVDVFPFRNKHWHVTGGFYWGGSTIAKAENATYDATSLVSLAIYNQLYDKVATSWKSQNSDDPEVLPEPYITFNGQPLYASEELYNKFNKWGRMGVHVGDYPDGTAYRMEPDENNMVSAKMKVNSFRPYLGAGYTGRLFKKKDCSWISVDLGGMFWGGTPKLVTHDGVDLCKDVTNIDGKVGRYVKFFKALKVYPVMEVRLTHRLF